MFKAMQEMVSIFEDDLIQSLIPFIDRTFRTLSDRDHRAMAGLSMGGMQTFQITFDHLDRPR
jgi:enterochelin esterase-like enzyme